MPREGVKKILDFSSALSPVPFIAAVNGPGHKPGQLGRAPKTGWKRGILLVKDGETEARM